MPERPRGRDPNRRTKHPQETPPASFARAVKYADAPSSEQPYDATRDLIHDNPCDLSVFRFIRMPPQEWIVAVLGHTPPDELVRRLDTTLASGEATALSDEELALLQERRRAQSRDGTVAWVETSLRRRRT